MYNNIYIHRPDYIHLRDLANKKEEKSNLPVEAAGIFHAFSHSKILTVSCTSSHLYIFPIFISSILINWELDYQHKSFAVSKRKRKEMSAQINNNIEVVRELRDPRAPTTLSFRVIIRQVKSTAARGKMGEEKEKVALYISLTFSLSLSLSHFFF
jgi:hypothetical protein